MLFCIKEGPESSPCPFPHHVGHTEGGSLQTRRGPQQTPIMLVPWSVTSQSLELWEVLSVYEPSCLWYFVIAAQMDWDSNIQLGQMRELNQQVMKKCLEQSLL